MKIRMLALSVFVVSCFFFSSMFQTLAHAQDNEVHLFANFSFGDPTGEIPDEIKVKKVMLKEVTVEALAKELSAWTGLDFFLNSVVEKDGSIYVDWSSKSTLIANLDDRKQKEEFHFFDADEMRWFMMNSLFDTISENLNNSMVHYTMDGGKDLVFENLSLLNHFPANVPFMGSNFYYAHEGDAGDME